MTQKLVFATHNRNKVAEVRQILEPLGFEILSADDLNLVDVEETGTTFRENALLKARAAFAATGQAVMADDSGLCIPALDGAPGIYAARFAAAHGGYPAVFDYLNQMLAGKDRSAYFICTIALILQNGEEFVFEGRVDGQLDERPSGPHTFGYDPIFVPQGYSETFGVLEPDVKNKISHRARALEQLRAFLEKRI